MLPSRVSIKILASKTSITPADEAAPVVKSQ